MKSLTLNIIFLLFFVSCQHPQKEHKIDITKIPKDTHRAVKKIEKNHKIEKLTKADIDSIIEQNQNKGKYYALLKDSIKIEYLDYMPPSELVRIRNEIFAKYCYAFNNKELRDYFEKTTWYVPYYKNVYTFLTEKDKHNIKVLLEAESENEEISKEEMFNWYIKEIEDPPKALCVFFNCPIMRSYFDGTHLSWHTHVLSASEKCKFLLYSYWGGCSRCYPQLNLNRYSLEGKLIESINFHTIIYPDAKTNYYPDSLIIVNQWHKLKDNVEVPSDSVLLILDEYGYNSQYHVKYKHTDKIFLQENDKIKISQEEILLPDE